MRQRLHILLALLVIMTNYMFAENISGKKIENRVPNRIVVWFHKGTTEEQIDDFIKRFSEYGLQKFPYYNSFLRDFWFDEGLVEDDNAFIEQIKKDIIIEGGDFSRYIEMINDPPVEQWPVELGMLSPLQITPWSARHIGIDEVWDLYRFDIPSNFKPVVAVVDRGHYEFVSLEDNLFYNTGEDFPQLEQIIYPLSYLGVPNTQETAIVAYPLGNGEDDDQNGAIDDYGKWIAPPSPYYHTNPKNDYHGPIIINIINEVFNYRFETGFDSGISYIRYFPIQCASYQDPTNYKNVYLNAVIKALEYTLKRRREYNLDPNEGVPFVAVNFSLGSADDVECADYLAPFVAYVDSLDQAGVLTIVGAGNGALNIDSTFYFPASLESIYMIKVASHDSLNVLGNNSNYGIEKVDLAATGENIFYSLSLGVHILPYPPYHNGYNTTLTYPGHARSSSFAVPHVTGTIEMMYRAASNASIDFGEMTPGEIAIQMKQWLLDAVVPVDSLANYVRTGGRLNARDAILNVRIPYVTITEDSTLTQDEVLDKRYIIKNGARLSVQDSNITAPQPGDINSQYYGFYVYSGSLEFINSTVNFGNGRIELHGSTLISDDSTINIEDGYLILKGGSLIEMNNGSNMSLTGESKITGNSSENIEGYYAWNDHYITTLHTRGDRIYINNSQIHLGSGTSISTSSNQKWEGMYFTSCNDNTAISTISADISGIVKIDINTSTVSFESSTIHDINSILVNMSEVELISTEIYNISDLRADNNSHLVLSDGSRYHDNEYGIVAYDSQVSFNSSFIYNNRNYAGLSINNSAVDASTVINSQIYSNSSFGLEIRNAWVDVVNSEIRDNGSVGYHNMFSGISGKVKGNTQIYDNGSIEIFSRSTSFPRFEAIGSQIPEIYDSIHTPDNDILLLVDPLYVNPIHVHPVEIVTTSTRFRPNISYYCFGCAIVARPEADILFSQTLSYIDEKEFCLAISEMKNIIETYPSSEEAKLAMAYLPYLQGQIDEDFEDLLLYLELIDHDDLADIKQEVMALTSMFFKDYASAVELFEEIINNPPSEIDGLKAELDQAYCYLKMMETETRSILTNATKSPRTINEYNQIKEDIDKRLFELLNIEQPDTVINAIPFITRNYPNPFNPETTISFTLPKEGPVSIDIYNIKGQKVKSLVHDTFLAGQHQVVWSGDNDFHQAVGSGIYLYRIKTKENTAARKMLLIK